MCARILAFLSLLLLCLAATSAAEQTGGDKSKDAGPKKDPDTISAATEINGKNLDQWIKLISGKDRSMTKTAIEAIVLYPPELAVQAVPAMVKELNKHNANNPIDLSVRTTIPQPLAFILIRVQNPDPQMVKEAVTVLKRMLKSDSQVIVKLRAAQALAQMGALAKDALQELIHVVKDGVSETWELRQAAVVALGTVGVTSEKEPPSKDVVLALQRNGLKDTSHVVRLHAIDSLVDVRAGKFDQYKTALYNDLVKMSAEDPDPICRIHADVFIYTMLDKAADKVKRREVIGRFLEHKDRQVKMEAVKMLGLMGEEARDQVSRLVGTLRDKDATVVALSVVALAQIKDRSAVPDLARLANDANQPEIIRNTAKDAIGRISGQKSNQEEPKKGGAK